MSQVPGWEHVDYEIMSSCKLMAYYLKIHWKRIKKKEAEDLAKNPKKNPPAPKSVASNKSSKLASMWDKPDPNATQRQLEQERLNRMKEKSEKVKAQREKFELMKKRDEERKAHEALMKKKDKEAKELQQREAKYRLEEENKRKAAEEKANQLAKEKKEKEDQLLRQKFEANAKLKAMEREKEDQEKKRLAAENEAKLKASEKERAEKELEEMKRQKAEDRAERKRLEHEVRGHIFVSFNQFRLNSGLRQRTQTKLEHLVIRIMRSSMMKEMEL